jgi:LysR family nitrogen assimilation transcriptional regulator
LECFVRICELGSITKASRTLNIAQPALGIQVKALEREFGVRLLERTVLGTRPTEAGQMFLEEAKFILRRLQDLKRSLREQAASEPQVITLGLTPSLTGILPTRLLERIMATLPRVKLTVVEELSHILIERVEAGRLDLALIYNVPDDRGFEREPQLREVLYLVTSPGSRLDQPGPVKLADVAATELTMPSGGDVLRRLVEEQMRAAGLPLRIAYSMDSMQAIKAVIARGLACGVLPASAISLELQSGTLRARRIEPPLSRTLYLVRPSAGGLGAPAQQVMTVIRSVLLELIAENASFDAV